MKVHLKIKVKNSVEKCISLAGSKQVSLAHLLGDNYKQQTISRWKKQGYIPPKHFPKLLELFDHSLTEQELLYDFYQAQKKKQNKQKTK
ncbi:helix-turn-helix domain-containing protein [Pleionea sediminis]|uniref:helix-turn-helix domain-containing protein n=1 Tax=Pleionea sediminis TaxID=2569479 RepID=UPI001185C3A4|nr:helix-turn-helix domain-containing protein [Pleionea sediminis]